MFARALLDSLDVTRVVFLHTIQRSEFHTVLWCSRHATVSDRLVPHSRTFIDSSIDFILQLEESSYGLSVILDGLVLLKL